MLGGNESSAFCIPTIFAGQDTSAGLQDTITMLLCHMFDLTQKLRHLLLEYCTWP